MAKNKMSFWAVFILVVTIISTIMLAVGVIAFAISIGPAQELARQEAVKQGLSDADIQIAVAVVTTGLIGAFVASSILEVLQIIGGFLFSLKGRWGIFCIIMAILSGGTNIFELINAISKGSGVFAIVTASVAVVLSVLMIIACFKHRAENRHA